MENESHYRIILGASDCKSMVVVTKLILLVIISAIVLCHEASGKENVAYTKADGTMVIGQWMRDMCASEDELAAIVMHEKAHLVLKHGEKTWYEKLFGWFAGWFTDEGIVEYKY